MRAAVLSGNGSAFGKRSRSWIARVEVVRPVALSSDDYLLTPRDSRGSLLIKSRRPSSTRRGEKIRIGRHPSIFARCHAAQGLIQRLPKLVGPSSLQALTAVVGEGRSASV
jgi:hypothetical protein